MQALAEAQRQRRRTDNNKAAYASKRGPVRPLLLLTDGCRLNSVPGGDELCSQPTRGHRASVRRCLAQARLLRGGLILRRNLHPAESPGKRQAELVGISRGTVYYQPEPISDADLRLMRRIDELHLELPFAGSRMLRDLLIGEGFEVERRHVATLMRKMGVQALYRKPNTSKKHPKHAVFPYLLRGLAIERANQVWAMDMSAPCRRDLQRQRERSDTVSESKLADSRPAAAMLPRAGGGRAKGGCKARPFADGGVSCAEQPELYRALAACGRRVGLPQGLW